MFVVCLFLSKHDSDWARYGQIWRAWVNSSMVRLLQYAVGAAQLWHCYGACQYVYILTVLPHMQLVYFSALDLSFVFLLKHVYAVVLLYMQLHQCIGILTQVVE